MLTLCALVTFACGASGISAILADNRKDKRLGRVPTPDTRLGDFFWIVVSGCMAVTAMHSLAASWF